MLWVRLLTEVFRKYGRPYEGLQACDFKWVRRKKRRFDLGHGRVVSYRIKPKKLLLKLIIINYNKY
jgi:hypothetical protein